MAALIGENKKKLKARKEETPIILKWDENQKESTQKEGKEKLINDDNKVPNLKEVRSSKRPKRNPFTRNEDFFMDKGVVIDNVIDNTVSHNTGGKRLGNVTTLNSHTTRNNSSNKVPFSNKCLCATSYINDTQLEALMSNDTINVEHTLVKDSSQVPRNKSLKIFHKNIRGLGNKSNELYCHLHH
jgi:hypothetical protein